MQENPSYVVINDDTQSKERRSILRKHASAITFPMSPEDTKIMDILESKYDAEENCAGLAAPQIGFSKRIIIFSVPDDPELKKWRSDLTQTMPKTIWINPSYEKVNDTRHEDYEGCFSVKDLAGPVKRFSKIHYSATLPDGMSISGVAEGFLARLIQHEIDHLNGTLCIDKMPKDKILTIEEYRKKQALALKKNQNE